jgi:hypothetical protein
VSFGLQAVPLPIEVPNGYEVTIPFQITAPLESGDYPFVWAIEHAGVGTMQEHSPEVDVHVHSPASCTEVGPPARFRSQMPPSGFLGTGQRFTATLTFANCSTDTWTRAGFHLGSQAPMDNDTWGTTRVELPEDVPPGAEVTVTIHGTAPTQVGSYRFSWEVLRDADMHWYGEPSAPVTVTVLETVDCTDTSPDAVFVRQSPPGTLDPNQDFDASITFGNCGNAVWDASYHLAPLNGSIGSTWGVDRVGLALPVGPGFALTIPFHGRAPGNPGDYDYRWAIAHDGQGNLNEPSPAYSVTVRCIPQCGGRNCGGDGCGGSCGTCGGGQTCSASGQCVCAPNCAGRACGDDGCGGSCGTCGGGATCDGGTCQAATLSCGNVQWWNSYITYEHWSGSWHDTDLGVRSSSPVQIRHNSRLDNYGVYGWGYMPEFTDMVTGVQFKMLHLRPQHQWATERGRIYPAGYVVGLSGGDTYDTGYPVYSTGAHLCIQTLVPYRTAFPTGDDYCR